MKQTFLSFLLPILVIAMLGQLTMSEAQARRFGGGASFGSRPSFSKSFKRAPVKRTLSPAQKQAATKNQNLRNNMRQRGGVMGMLGALAMGGLLGSLLFGGAFENFNLFDILLIGGLMYFLFKLMTRSQQAAATRSHARSSYQDADFDPLNPSPTTTRSFNTDLMFKQNRSVEDSADQPQKHDAAIIEIDNFDSSAFLEGAKGAFQMLQHAWDTGDQSEIRRMTTDKVFAEIKQQLQTKSIDNHTEIMSLNAEILSARQSDNQQEVQVMFDANIHEQPESITSNVQELWHFIRPVHSGDSMWYVDGIQQVD